MDRLLLTVRTEWGAHRSYGTYRAAGALLHCLGRDNLLEQARSPATSPSAASMRRWGKAEHNFEDDHKDEAEEDQQSAADLPVVTAVTVTADSKKAVCTCDDGAVRVFLLSNGALEREIRSGGHIGSVVCMVLDLSLPVKACHRILANRTKDNG